MGVVGIAVAEMGLGAFGRSYIILEMSIVLVNDVPVGIEVATPWHDFGAIDWRYHLLRIGVIGACSFNSKALHHFPHRLWQG